MWTCVGCGEEIDAGFEVCWSCGTSIDGVKDPYFDSESDPRITTEPPPPLPTLNERFVTVATFYSSPEAHALRCLLEAEGLTVFLADEFSINLGVLSNEIGGIKVQVADSDAERALAIVAEGKLEHPDDEDEVDTESDDRIQERRPPGLSDSKDDDRFRAK